jgi:hypothetical protein
MMRSNSTNAAQQAILRTDRSTVEENSAPKILAAMQRAMFPAVVAAAAGGEVSTAALAGGWRWPFLLSLSPFPRSQAHTPASVVE